MTGRLTKTHKSNKSIFTPLLLVYAISIFFRQWLRQ